MLLKLFPKNMQILYQYLGLERVHEVKVEKKILFYKIL